MYIIIIMNDSLGAKKSPQITSLSVISTTDTVVKLENAAAPSPSLYTHVQRSRGVRRRRGRGRRRGYLIPVLYDCLYLLEHLQINDCAGRYARRTQLKGAHLSCSTGPSL